jgi:tetratricopeptide (TPR) repeat protein
LLAVSSLSFSQATTYHQWIERAVKFIDTNQLDSAVVALQQAMTLEPGNPNNTILLFNLGVMQRELGRFEAALSSLSASLTNSPDATAVLFHRAALLTEMERFCEAIEDFDVIIRHNPHNTEALYRRGVLFLERGDRASAEADFKEAERINPNDFHTKLSRALLYKLNDEWYAAEAIYTQLINASEVPNYSLYLSRAECFVNTERFPEAANDLRVVEVSRTQMDNPFFFFLRGRVRLALHDRNAARDDFRRAGELGYFADIVEEWIGRAGR